jgi:pyruvate carboxylase
MKQPLTLAASMFLALSLFGGIVYSGFNRNISPTSSVPTNSPMQVKNIRSVSINNQIQVKDLNHSGHNSVVPESVIDFLGKYNLAKYRKQFFEALQANRFTEISKTIFEETGYMLVRLNHVSDDIKKKYGTLQNISNVEDHQDVYLFWRPPVIFKKFYYYYEGEEVLALQKMMAKMHLYTARLDGKVGKNLMMAVVGFQKQMGLPVTGFPDSKTIFLLCHEVEDITNDA